MVEFQPFFLILELDSHALAVVSLIGASVVTVEEIQVEDPLFEEEEESELFDDK